MVSHEEYRASWRAAGIPAAYCDPTKGLQQYIERPENNGVRREQARTLQSLITSPLPQVQACPANVFVCDDDSEAFSLYARALLVVKRVQVFMTDLVTLEQPRNSEFFGELFERQTKYLFIHNFYDPFFPNGFGADRHLTMQLNMQWLMNRGIALSFQAPCLLKDCVWWSPQFLKLASNSCTHIF